MKRGQKRLLEPEVEEIGNKTISSSLDRAASLVNPQKTWLPAWKLPKAKPVNIPTWRKKEHMKTNSRQLLEDRVSFHDYVAAGKFAMLQWMSLHPEVFGKHKLNSVGY